MKVDDATRVYIEDLERKADNLVRIVKVAEDALHDVHRILAHFKDHVGISEQPELPLPGGGTGCSGEGGLEAGAGDAKTVRRILYADRPGEDG